MFSVRELDEHAVFDPYVEEEKRRNHHPHHIDNRPAVNGRDGKFVRKAKEVTHRASISLLRFEASLSANATMKRKASSSSSSSTTATAAAAATAAAVVSAVSAPVVKQQHCYTHPHEKPKTTKTKAKARERSPDVLRRWTLAMADVPDEVLVQELERLRMEGRGSRRKRRGGTSSNGHSTVEHERDEKTLVYGGPEEHKWREEWVKLRDDSDTESEMSQSEEFSDEEERQEEEEGEEASRWSEQDDTEWKSARRALLCCRELVRTERSYQARLRQLLSGDTETAPPALVLTYVPALLNASEALLTRLEDDPSAWGVSAAFVGVEEEIEAAFVAWCGVVGEIFRDGVVSPASGGASHNSDNNRTSGSERASWISARSPKASPTISPSSAPSGLLGKRSVSSVAISHTQAESIYHRQNVAKLNETPKDGRRGSSTGIGMFTAALGTGLAYSISPSPSLCVSQPFSGYDFGVKSPPLRADLRSRSMAGVHTTGSASLSFSKALKRMSVFGSVTSLPSTPMMMTSAPASFSVSAGRKPQRKEQKSTVRELAIQPTQRVMRYVLQYRGTCVFSSEI